MFAETIKRSLIFFLSFFPPPSLYATSGDIPPVIVVIKYLPHSSAKITQFVKCKLKLCSLHRFHYRDFFLWWGYFFMADLPRILVFPVNIVCTASCHGAVFFAFWFRVSCVFTPEINGGTCLVLVLMCAVCCGSGGRVGGIICTSCAAVCERQLFVTCS